MGELRLENSIVDERYYIDRCLGRGSYAEIFLAFDQQQDDLPVIIKALNVSLQGTPDVELKRTLIENFQNEAIALDAVRHTHIIRRLGHGTATDLAGVVFHFLVLEYMAGGDLLSVCNKRTFTLDETLFYFQQVAEALAYAHSQHVIHRDIKPKNLLLSADHKILKIADFGVAKMTLESDREITRVGTDVYAPPEHHPDGETREDGDWQESEERLTPSADVYSLAKTIYTAMTGRAPRQFSRKPILELPPDLATQLWGKALLRVLHKATATRVTDRYATVQSFWQDFAALQKIVEASEDDHEKTLVRSRLKVTSDIESPASQPNFQALAAAAVERKPLKARIVVELPTRMPDPEVAKQETSEHASGEPAEAEAGQAPGRPATAVTQADVDVPPATIVAEKPVGRTQPMGAPVRTVERSPLDRVRAVIKSDWLRRVFIIFLIAALVGLVASTYFRFAGNRNAASIVNWFNDKEGEITNADFVNLRASPSPSAEIWRWLPRGTKILLLEERGSWLRIRVTSEPSVDLPPEAPRLKLDAKSGWIRGNLAQF